MIAEQIKAAIRDIPDFPKPGIIFKDITPILKDPVLCSAIVEALAEKMAGIKIDVVAGVESRGFLFGLMLAVKLGVPFVPVRKAGKLPHTVKQKGYELEYGTSTIEMHTDAIKPGDRVLIHDDLLATGGTAMAAGELIQDLGGIVSVYCFITCLSFLGGIQRILSVSQNIVILANY